MTPNPHPTFTRLKLRVKPAAEASIRSGHPWVFDESVREQSRPGKAGELAVIYDRQDRFLAIGLFDPDSPIRLRILHRGNPEPLDGEWWKGHLKAALDKRRSMFDAATTGFRWINGENDGWPALVMDRYGETLVLKLYSAAWLPQLNFVLDLVRQELNPERIVLRLSRNVQEAAGARFQLSDGQVMFGPEVEQPVVFLESGLVFEADVLRGQKTGFFLDQRENRRRVERLARGARVLNAFSFSGGFSVYAARGGAESVTDVDISAHALESAKRNFQLNAVAVGKSRYWQVQADVFEWVASVRRGEFDLVVLDPPSLARRESEREGALQAYGRLCEQACKGVAPKGKLVACSCSAHVPAPAFYQVIRESAARTRRKWRVLETAEHAPDHVATFKEGQYLKAIYLEILD